MPNLEIVQAGGSEGEVRAGRSRPKDDLPRGVLNKEQGQMPLLTTVTPVSSYLKLFGSRSAASLQRAHHR